MKNKALKVITSIERLGVAEKGSKRAHAKGVNYHADVQLNEEGRQLLGDMTHAIVRLSDAPPSTKYPSWSVSLKGLSIRLSGNNQPVDLVFVTFPYFPWVKADSIVEIGNYAVALKEQSDWQVKLNLWRKILQIENFHQHICKFIRHMPIVTYRTHRKYYNLHYFRTVNDDFTRFHVKYINHQILLYTERYHQAASIEQIRRDGTVRHIGTIRLIQETDEQIDYFDVMQTGDYLRPLDDDEILLLRHYMYNISYERKKKERESHE